MSGDDKNNDFCASFESQRTNMHALLLLTDSLLAKFIVRCRLIGQASNFALPKVASFAPVTSLSCTFVAKAILPTVRSRFWSHPVHTAERGRKEGVCLARRVRL